MKITTAQRNLLSQRPNYSDLRLSIYQPTVLLGCKVATGTYVIGSERINYDTVSTGSYANVVPGVTCYIGSSANKADLGRLRVREVNSTSIKFATNGHTWNMGEYLTVVNYHEIWPVYTSFEVNSTNDGYIDYMDMDVAYSNQNALMGSLICMGPNRATYMENGSAMLYYSSSGTSNILGESLTYSWNFGGGTPSTSASGTPGYVTYSTPGHYVTKLQTISTSGATGTSYRHVSIYPSKDDFTYKNWGISDISGSRESGGYYAKIWIRGQLPEVVDGSLVVIQGDHWAGNTKINFGLNAENEPGVFFTGYIIDGSVEYNYQDSKITFEVLSPAGLMKLKESLSYSVASVATTPTKWGEIKDLTWKKSAFFYLRWLTTILETCDVQIMGTDYATQYLEFDQGNLYDSIASYVQTKVFGEVVSDLQGKLWIEPGVAALNNATGTIAEGMSLSKYDWRDVIVVDEQNSQKLSQLEIGGSSFISAASGISVPMLSIAPGSYPNYFGKRDSSLQGFVIDNQTNLNKLSGNIFAWKNARYPVVEIKLAGTYLNLDLAPQENVPLTILPEDTNYRLNWNKKPFTIQDLSWEYDPEQKLLLPSVSMHEITQGIPGETEPIPAPADINLPPDPPGVDFIDLPTWSFPPFTGFVPPVVVPPPDDSTLDTTQCREDLNAPPNGPFPLGSIRGTLTDKNPQIYFPVFGWDGAWMRPGTATNVTSYLFNGAFETFNSTTNMWEPNTNKDFIHVYAIGEDGNRIAVGVMDDVSSPNVRSGKFYPPAGATIRYIEMMLDFTNVPYCTSAVVTRSTLAGGVSYATGTITMTGVNSSSYFYYHEDNLWMGNNTIFTDAHLSISLDTMWSADIAPHHFRVQGMLYLPKSNPSLGTNQLYTVRRAATGPVITGAGVTSFDRSDLSTDTVPQYHMLVTYSTQTPKSNLPGYAEVMLSVECLETNRCTITSSYLWNICTPVYTY